MPLSAPFVARLCALLLLFVSVIAEHERGIVLEEHEVHENSVALKEREHGIPPAEVSEYAPLSGGRLLKEVTKPKRKFCNTSAYSLKGDYAYEACGAFCKQAKAPNHCKFCKCRSCSFCKAAAAAAVTGHSTSPASTKGGSSMSASASAAGGGAAAPKRKKKGVGLGGKKNSAGGKLSSKKKAKKGALKRKLRQTTAPAPGS